MNTKCLGKIILLSLLCVLVFGVSQAMAMSVHIVVPNNYLDINAGEKLGFEVSIGYPENPARRNVRVVYQLWKGDSMVMQLDPIEKSVESGVNFMDFITIPKDLGTGMYAITARVSDYKDVIVTDSANFHVLGNRDERIKIYFLSVFGVVVLMVFVLVIVRDFLSKKVKEEKIESVPKE